MSLRTDAWKAGASTIGAPRDEGNVVVELLHRSMAVFAACALLAGATSGASAQAWPTRTVKVVVPYAPGGVTDTMARITADRLGKMLGQTVFIETRPGAGGGIGVDYALHSAHDGYAIRCVGGSAFT